MIWLDCPHDQLVSLSVSQILLLSLLSLFSFFFLFGIAAQLEEGVDTTEGGSGGGGKSIWDAFVNGPQEALDMIMDPNKKEREEEVKMKKEVKAAKKVWRTIRKERFAFLDIDSSTTNEEKKVSEYSA